jgi:hypothetical protein
MGIGASLNRIVLRQVLTMRATVWARTGGTGPYNSAVKMDLACRLDTLDLHPGATSSQRAELAALRSLFWDTAYDLPEQGVQVEIISPANYAGQRWNVIAGTRRPEIMPGFDETICIAVDVRRAN